MAWPTESGSLGTITGRRRRRPPRRPAGRVFSAPVAPTACTYTLTRLGDVTQIDVTTWLAGVVYYCWYLDGILIDTTTSPRLWIQTAVGYQARLEVIASNDPDFDTESNAPAGWPSRRLIWWVRSVDSDVVSYRVEQDQDGGGWSTVATVAAVADQWEYQVLSDRLEDLAQYTWRVVPIDAAGNDGTPIAAGEEKIVRTPDAPNFAIAFDDGTTKVTFSAA